MAGLSLGIEVLDKAGKAAGAAFRGTIVGPFGVGAFGRFQAINAKPDPHDAVFDSGARKKLPPLKNPQAVLTSLLFRTRNIPAALYKALGGFATNGVSIAKLESYVDPTFQAAQFYCEAEGHPESAALRLALEELSFFADEVRVMGAYQAHAFRRKKKPSPMKPKRRR